VHHGGDGAFAVGAADVNGGEAAFGMVERFAQARDILETKLDPEQLEGEETI
jgi:hypothetical protein